MSCPVRSSFLVILKLISGYTSPWLTRVWPTPRPYTVCPPLVSPKHQYLRIVAALSCPLASREWNSHYVCHMYTPNRPILCNWCKCLVAEKISISLDKLKCPFSEVTVIITFVNHTLLSGLLTYGAQSKHTTKPCECCLGKQSAVEYTSATQSALYCALSPLPTCHARVVSLLQR